MNDIEKVIKGLEQYQLAGWTGINDYYRPFIIDALALLKAQVPIKPKRYQEGRWFKTWRCGACGGTLVFRNGEDKPKYCIDCGRAVKWE